MLNPKVGKTVEVDGGVRVATRAGVSGNAVYGPYERRGPGIYEVEFELALAGRPPRRGDPVVATLDVTANFGEAALAVQELRASELSRDVARFRLTFTLMEVRTLEYRVHASGACALLIGAEPQARRVGDVIDGAGPPRADGGALDRFALNQEVRAIMRLLRPHAARDVAKARFGALGDGGYVHLDDFTGVDTALSFGINDDISWDLDVADRGLTVYQFDHTVVDPAPDDPRLVFERKMIAPEPGPDRESLEALVRRHDKGRATPNIILKMDIENAEWAVFQTTDSEALGRLSQIVCELHAFQNLHDPRWQQGVRDAFKKLNEHFAVVHVHANVCGGISNIANVILPNVLEVTFANRRMYAVDRSDELFPGPLDASCDINQPDMFLGSFRF